MTIHNRSYYPATDFTRVGDFLRKHYLPCNRDGNWFEAAWDYMHSHTYLDETALDKIGIWEEAGEIVGVAHYESRLGEAFFQIHPGYPRLKPELLDYAEKNLYAITPAGERCLKAYINDFDTGFETLVRSRGYDRAAQDDRPTSMLDLPDPFPEIQLPDGFRLKSLLEENDLHKIDRVLWRGFNHPGESPEDGIEGRRKMQSADNFRKDLNVVVAAPDGNFAAYAGTWYDPANRIAYVEPVATDPDFRRRGLGKAAVLEGIRRCGELGAAVAYVGSDQEFYQAMGFKKIYTSRCWMKRFDTD